ncbi:MAG: hypothetical protein LC723_05630 [Actinobacteria bacterium]|nr:hypothetical protein [Actinomycetota bacterium]
MPVLISGFERDLDIIRPLAARLVSGGGEVRCYLEDDDHELRSLGCKIAVGRLDDDSTLEAALTNVHTFVPLLPDALSLVDLDASGRLEGMIAAIESALSFAKVASCIAAISAMGRPPITNQLDDLTLHLSQMDVPTCIVRVGTMIGEERPVRYASQEGTKIRAVTVPMLIDVIAAADDLESDDETLQLGGILVEADLGASGWEGRAKATSHLDNSALDRFKIASQEHSGHAEHLGAQGLN